ncbi:hypothetical protein RM531_15845 [Salinisphaera sp. P385]|uniref:Uncharacterized protein n=1 Tax=Spectribacter acetivorans TaxID=3075603 RepID=A0ABU3BBT3_9GAMM|nr:hypothetical protein [Salinisphaera sp. P385]MDT0619941.1 hypothetical protein [Salinisphaera sp. P385]
MIIEENPFHVLRANTRDSRQRLVELADEQTLLQDEQVVAEARSTLTNPRRRLAAEIAWMPGISPARCQDAANALVNKPSSLLKTKNGPLLATANVVASAFTKCAGELSKSQFADVVATICETFEHVDAEEIQSLLNQDRAISGFPEITELTLVEEALESRRADLRGLLRDSFNQLSSKALVYFLTHVVEETTDVGAHPAPVLLDDLVDAYEVDARAYFEQQDEAVRVAADNIKQAADIQADEEQLSRLIDDFALLVKNWDVVAQPIQVSVRSRGLIHEASESMARLVRDLAVWLYNEHNQLDLAKRLTDLQHQVFAELDHVIEQVSEDAAALDDIALKRAEMIEHSQEESEAWRDEMSYRAQWGTIFKKQVEISADAIEWNGKETPLHSITAVRWGGTKHYTHGVPTGTTYKVVFKNKNGSPRIIELKNEAIYANLIERLWKGVCVRLLTEMLVELRDGGVRNFGQAVVRDTGVELPRSKLFGAKEHVLCCWGDLVVTNGGGCFVIKKKDEKKVNAVLEYQEDDNAHILETAIRAYFKNPSNGKLSSLLH